MRNLFFALLMTITSTVAFAGDIWDNIRTTTLAPNSSATEGRALPLAASWQAGWYKYKWGDNRGETLYTPDYLIDLINKQHHLLVGFAHLAPNE